MKMQTNFKNSYLKMMLIVVFDSCGLSTWAIVHFSMLFKKKKKRLFKSSIGAKQYINKQKIWIMKYDSKVKYACKN